MTQAALSRAKRLTDQHQKYNAIAYRNVCAMCSSPLSIPWNGQKDTFELVCSKNREHQGYTRLKTIYQKWRDGEALPVEVAQAMEFRYGKRGNT